MHTLIYCIIFAKSVVMVVECCRETHIAVYTLMYCIIVAKSVVIVVERCSETHMVDPNIVGVIYVHNMYNYWL